MVESSLVTILELVLVASSVKVPVLLSWVAVGVVPFWRLVLLVALEVARRQLSKVVLAYLGIFGC